MSQIPRAIFRRLYHTIRQAQPVQGFRRRRSLPPTTGDLPIITACAPFNFINVNDVQNSLPSSAKATKLEDKYLYVRYSQNSEVFIFQDGMFVCWDMSEQDQKELAEIVKKSAKNAFPQDIVREEVEQMSYKLSDTETSSITDELAVVSMSSPDVFYDIYRSNHPDASVDGPEVSAAPTVDEYSTEAIWNRLAFSHAIGNSCKMGVLEAMVQRYSMKGDHSIQAINSALLKGKITMSKKDALVQLGKFNDMRHSINLNTAILEPDVYWDREGLDALYTKVCKYYSLPSRISQINAQLDYCEHTVGIVDQLLNHRQSIRLEWLIIWLIAVEVVIELARWRLEYKDQEERKK